MTYGELEPAVRRVAIALTGREVPASLIAWVLRAVNLSEPVELSAVFIEDSDLLNAVALPFTAEFCVLTNDVRPIDRAHLEAYFEREAAAAAQGIAELAVTLGSRCNFEVMRERKAVALVTALAAVDALLIPNPQRRNARPAAVATGPTAPIIAIVDQSVGGHACHRVALRLATAQAAPLEVYVVGQEGAAAITAFEPVSGAADVRQTVRPTTPAGVPALLARAGTRLILMAPQLLRPGEPPLFELDEVLAAPLLLTR